MFNSSSAFNSREMEEIMSKTHAIHEEIIINAPVNKVYSYLRNPINAVEWWPSITDIRDVKEVDGKHHYDFSYKMLGMNIEGSTIRVQDIPNKELKAVSKTGIESTLHWQFEELNESTRVIFKVDYHVPILLLGRLAERIITSSNANEAKLVMQNIKLRLEA